MGLLALVGTHSLFGLGFRIPNQDAEAIARGNAFVATADNPSAIYYNPAGITQLEDGHHIRLGVHVLALESTYEGPLGRSKTETEPPAVPQLYYVHAPKDQPFAWGLGIYSPFGLALEWPDDSGFRTVGSKGELVYATVNPVIAWSLTDSVDIAFGPTINRGDLTYKQGIVAPPDQFKFEGDDTQLGFTLGFRWEPAEKWAIGLSYHSAVSMELEGRTEARGFSPSESATASAEFPDFIKFGISFRPTPKWNFEVGLDWTDWDALDALVIDQSVSGTVALPLNWKSSIMINAGATRYFDNGYWLGFGYFFSENSVTELNFNPLVPDTDLHVGSLGVGSRIGRWDWALALQLITGPSRDVSGSVNGSLIGESADGNYQWLNYALNLAVQTSF